MNLCHSSKAITSLLLPVLLLSLTTGCGTIRRSAINMVGDAMNSGSSVFETDEDIELVGEALPFGLKFMEMLLGESPDHPGLLLTTCKGFVLYSYGYVDYEAFLAEEEDLDRSKAIKKRARKLYLRALKYGLRGLERSYPGFENQLFLEPEKAAAQITLKDMKRDLPFLVWNAAALGSAISVSRDDAAMVARLPEVEAMMNRALELDEAWEQGLIHQFKIQLAGAKVGDLDHDQIRGHYERALELSMGRNAGPYVAYVEAVSIPDQNISEFSSLLAMALAVDPDQYPEGRLLNLMAQRRAQWLLDHIDELFLGVDTISELKGGRP